MPKFLVDFELTGHIEVGGRNQRRSGRNRRKHRSRGAFREYSAF